MIIGIAGPIASGKSTLARALAGKFSLKLVSFGEFVRDTAQSRGLDLADRQTLQDLGQSLVDENAKAFVQDVFARANFQSTDRVVMDGLRHRVVWLEIVAFASSHGCRAQLVFLSMPEQERRMRLEARGLSPDEIAGQDRHPSEADVLNQLAEMADVRLDALLPQAVMLASIDEQLGLG